MEFEHAPCYRCGGVRWYTTWLRNPYEKGDMSCWSFCENCHQGYEFDKWQVWQTALFIEQEQGLTSD